MDFNANGSLVSAALDTEQVSGLTHNYYYYPARFSPRFVSTAINVLTSPGDLVVDPFVGGGTTLVESMVAGRQSVGLDISSLATFVSRVKTTILDEDDNASIRDWLVQLPSYMNLRRPPCRPSEWIANGYQRNISDAKTWPIRKSLELALSQIIKLDNQRQRDFARCIVLKTGQWAVHRRKQIPTAREFRHRLVSYGLQMLESMDDFATQVNECAEKNQNAVSQSTCLTVDATEFDFSKLPDIVTKPRLILTSPPYAGVHILYHRWQINGRKETPAPFWIADCLDGQGASHYTMGGRHHPDLYRYFSGVYDSFKAISSWMDADTQIVQMVGFSDRSWQLPKYLDTLSRCGLTEVKHPSMSNSGDGRLWRSVPNRKWYANRPQTVESNSEVVLFHRLT